MDDDTARDAMSPSEEQVPSEEPTVATSEQKPPALPGCTEPKYQKLDDRVVKVWRIMHAIGAIFPLAGVTAGGICLWIFTGFPEAFLVLIWLGFVCIFVFTTFWFPDREHEKWSYLLTEKILEMRFGIFWQTSVLIPLSRLQHVDLHRGPLERNYGLASLEIHTAGTKNASHTLPGLDTAIAVRLRDELIAAAHIEST